jgi:hypothetical protein
MKQGVDGIVGFRPAAVGAAFYDLRVAHVKPDRFILFFGKRKFLIPHDMKLPFVRQDQAPLT